MQLECCGVESYNDFKTSLDISIPGSCCGKDPTNAAVTCSQQEAYKEGCVVALKDLFKSACAALGGIALGIAAIEVNKLHKRKLVKRLNKTGKLSYIYIYISKTIW